MRVWKSETDRGAGAEALLMDAKEALAQMLANWERMSGSDPDEAGDDAERFEQSFYAFAECTVAWLRSVPDGPQSLEEAMRLPVIDDFRRRLPGPLVLNFETELEEALSDRGRLEDDA